jgi:hypothetical protein
MKECRCGHRKGAHYASDVVDGVTVRGLCAQLGCPCRGFVAKAGKAPTVDAVRLSPDAEIKELKSDLQQLRDRHEALVSALQQFGQHKADCECVRSRQFYGVTLGEGGRCTCGFRAALAKAGA